MNVSIVTAGYRLDHIEKTWQSIKKQTFKNWEWILVVDNSKDVLDWYNNKKLQERQYNTFSVNIGRNMGRYGLVARNIGAMCASSDIIFFLDDDNSFEEEDYMEKVLGVFLQTGKIPYTNLHLIGKKPGSTYDRIKKTGLGRQGIDLGNIIYKKKFFKKYGYFDDIENKIQYDWDFIEKIIKGEGEDAFLKVERNLIFRHKRY